MEQQIRYCTTVDGVRIAYATLGEGRPAYFSVPGMYGSLELTWEFADMRRYFEALARTMTVVRYDKRGSGLSDRDISDYSIEARTRDLEAVADDLGIERFFLTGSSEGGPVAMRYAAQHPERVAALTLIGTYASGRALRRLRGDFGEAMLGLIRAEWSVASRTLGDIINPDVPPDMEAQMSRVRDAVSGEHVTRMLEAMGRVEIEDLLPRVTCPTLVIHGRNDKAIPFELGRRIAAAIPGARFHADDLGHASLDPVRIAAMREFIAPEREATDDSPPRPRVAANTSVILFTDIADSTALTERLGDARFRDASRALDSSIRTAIRDAEGTPVEGKVLGDGVMGVFASAAQAIAAAGRCVELGGELPLHIGLHAGDVIREGDNVYGGAVNIASRICGMCEPGEILVSQTVRDLARTSAGVAFEDRGEHALKGIEDPVRVFAVLPTSSF